MRAAFVEEFGGAENIVVGERPDPRPGRGEVVVDVEFAGVNYMDTGMRTNAGGQWSPPQVLGAEGAGRVSRLGEGVTDLAVGDRVAWPLTFGSYAESVLARVDGLVPIPDDIGSDLAAAIIMQGLTAHHFTEEVAPLPAGATALVHAAAGGLGQIVSQLLRARGVRVVGLVSREEKVGAARRTGADEVLVHRDGDVVERVLELTDGLGVDAVFDNSDAAGFPDTLAVLARSATVCWYGPLMGPVPTLPLSQLPRSAKIAYGVFMDHIATRDQLLAHTHDLFDRIRSGALVVGADRRYPLDEAARAHHDIESRATTGKLLIEVAATTTSGRRVPR